MMPLGSQSWPQTAFIMCGLPASGKSTLAQRIALMLRDRMAGAQAVILDIDTLRMKTYESTGVRNAFEPERENAIRAEKLGAIEGELKKGNSIIDDDMNYFRSMRRESIELACKFRVHYAIIHVNTSLKQCLAWNSSRVNPVPDAVIKDVAAKLDVPGSRSYSWDEPLLVLNLGKQGIDTALDILRQEMDKRAISMRSKRQLETLLDGSGSVLENPAFWNLATFPRIVNDGFLINDVREWKDKIQGTSMSVLDQFEVATRRAIGIQASSGEAMTPERLKAVKSFKKDAMKTLKKQPRQLEALIDEFNTLLASKGRKP